MTRPLAVRALLPVGLVAGLACALGCADEAPRTRPSLLLVTVPNGPPDLLACDVHGPPARDPLCARMRGSTRYAWAFGPSPHLAPAAASLLTSRLASQHGVGRSAATFLPSRIATLPELLRRRGYETAAFVPEPALNRSRGLDRGFDRYDSAGTGSAAPCAAAQRAALRWAAGRAAPWLLWLHCPPAAAAAPRTRAGEPAGLEPERRGTLAALVARLDEEAGRLGVALVGLLGTGDGAQAAIAPARVRVALHWRAPGARPRAQGRVDDVVGLVDVTPTFVRAAGLEAPGGLEGEPLPGAGDADRSAASARALLVEDADARAVILGRRFYVRASSESEGTSVRLLDDGRLGQPERIAAYHEEVRLHEDRVRAALGRTEEPDAARASPVSPAGEEHDFRAGGKSVPNPRAENGGSKSPPG